MSYRFSSSQLVPDGESFCVGSLTKDILTINTAANSVTWHSNGAVRIVRQFKLNNAPLDAQFCAFESFPGTVSHSGPPNNAVAILLTNGDVHINLFTGELYEIHLPFTVKKMIALSNGLLFQRQTDGGDALQFYWLNHPISQLSAVEFHESAFELMNNAEGTVLCVQGQKVCCYSPHNNSISVLLLQPVTSAFHKHTHHNVVINNSQNSFAGGNLSAELQTPGDNIAQMDVDGSNLSYRTPTVYSREQSPDIVGLNIVNSFHPHAAAQSQYQSSASEKGMFAGNDAALRSLLGSNANSSSAASTPQHAMEPVTPVLRRTTSDNMSSSMRSQPLLYSRGTSGGSSNNSNSAYHIRKKRASAASPANNSNTSPRLSPRPSPSLFMFESAREVIGSSESPRGVRGKDANSGASLINSDNSGEAEALAAPLPPPVVFFTCLAQITLPEELKGSEGLQATFSGDFEAVGGLFVNIFDATTGSFYSYGLRRQDDTDAESMDEGSVNESQSHSHSHRSHHLDTSQGETGAHFHLELKYSYISGEATEGGGVLEGLRGAAHVSGALEGEATALRLQSARGAGKVLPAALQSTLLLPLTLLLTMQRKVLVLIGAQVVKEVPLKWIDDLEDDEALLNEQAQSAMQIATIHADGVHFAVKCHDGTRVVSLMALLSDEAVPHHLVSTSSSHRRAATVATSAVQPLVEVIKALVPALKLLNTEGLVECVLGFLLNVRAEVGSEMVLHWLLCASFGVDFKFFAQHYPSTVTNKSHYLRQIYQVFSADAQRLYAASRDHCIAAEVFSCAHSVLQDYLLRLDSRALTGGSSSSSSGGVGGAGGVHALKAVLQAVVGTVKKFHQSKQDSAMAQAYLSLMGTYGDYYASSGALGRSDVDAVTWCKETIETISAPSSNGMLLQEFPLPPELTPGSLLPCPTLRLSARFLEHFANLTTLPGEVVAEASSAAELRGAHSAARDVLDAFVFAVHGAQAIGALGDNLNGVFGGIRANSHVAFATVVSYFPHALRLLIEVCVKQCQGAPNPLWPAYLLKLVDRKDLGGFEVNQDTLLALKKLNLTAVPDSNPAAKPKNGASGATSGAAGANKPGTEAVQASTSDGLQEVEVASQLRFTEDDRVHEVCRMLRSSHHVYLKFEKAPEVSELDHRHKLQMKLLLLLRRTLACAVGRGMLTIASLEPLMAEALPIPPLSLTGRVPPTNSIITLDTTSAPEELTLWPDFHNGVAAALRVGPLDHQAHSQGQGQGGVRSGLGARSKVTRNWIMYNRTASQAKPGGNSTHAGFLLGLGLLGHLTNLTVSDTYDYLVQSYEPTTIAVLVGSAASKLGTADPRLSKTISLHMPALLPTQHNDMDISPPVQTAALVSLGLLHCGSGHRLMTEFLLAEMARSPSSDRCECRDAMVTAAAWALGMVLLGKGSKESSSAEADKKPTPAVPVTPGAEMPTQTAAGVTKEEDVLRGLADLRVENRLLQFIDGGKRPGESLLFPLHSSVDISSRSSRMLEGEEINTNLTAPGATIALALIFIRSNNADILARIALPTTIVALDAIRPDLLIYRAMATCLIQWDRAVPTTEWIKSKIPQPILRALFPEEALRSDTAKVDLNLLYQSAKKLDGRTALSLYLSAVTGFCYGIGIVFAGTSDETAKKTLLGHVKLLQGFRDNKPLIKLPFTLDKTLRQCVEMCLSLAALSLSSVMAGSGDIDCLRTLRELRWRYEDVSFGTHMALSMAIGMLFLGGGNYSLRRDPVSAACLLLSFAPRFPLRTIDHQYHLQALRHLYVLAAEPRALHTIDVDSGLTVSVNVQVELVDGRVLSMLAPGLLPELSTIRRISVAPREDTDVDDPAAPLKIAYYPTFIELQKPSGGDLQGTSFTLRMKHSGQHSRTQDQISVPPLFVKQIPRASYDTTPAVETAPVVDVSEQKWMSQLHHLVIPRSFKEVHEVHSPLEESVCRETSPAEQLGSLLSGSEGVRGAEVVLGQALCKNEKFLHLILESMTS